MVRESIRQTAVVRLLHEKKPWQSTSDGYAFDTERKTGIGTSSGLHGL